MLLLLFALQYDYEYDENGDRVILGKGTYGIVYAGRDLSNQVRIAIKEIPERDSRYGNWLIPDFVHYMISSLMWLMNLLIKECLFYKAAYKLPVCGI